MIRHIVTSLGATLTVIVFLFSLCVSPGYAQSDLGLTGPPVGLSLNLAAEASVNDIVTATVTAYDADGNSVDVTPNVTISSDSPDIVLPFSDATLGCVGGVGTATVTASFDDLQVSQQFRVNNTINSSGSLQIISLYPKATDLETAKQPTFTPGEKRQMLVYCTDGAGAEISGLCTFSMGDETIAKVQAAPDQNAPPPGEVQGVSDGETTLTATTGALTGTTTIKVVGVKTILSPVAVLSNTGGEYSSSYALTNVINRSGLSIPFQSGITDFDAYIAQNPTHTYYAGGYEWWTPDATTTAVVTLDLGASYLIDRMALWNEDYDGVTSILLDASDDPAFANSVTIGNVNPTDTVPYLDYGVQVFNLTPTSARYIRMQITGPKIAAGQSQIAMGEVAFSVTPVQPSGGASLMERVNPFNQTFLALLNGVRSDFRFGPAPAAPTRVKIGPMIPLKTKTAVSGAQTRPVRRQPLI